MCVYNVQLWIEFLVLDVKQINLKKTVLYSIGHFLLYR